MPKFVKASYNEKTLTVEYVADNGDRLLRSGGTIAWRFNNPGNLRPGPRYTLHIGQGKTASGPFLVFPTPEAGRAEKKGLLLRKYKDDSISGMLHIYAPPKENDTERYIQSVCKKTGFSRDQIIGKLSDDGLEKLMTSMEEHEGYHHKKETRDERWVRITSIGFSDGARPLADLPVKVKRNNEELIFKTNSRGQLKPLAHRKPEESVELWVQNVEKDWTKLDTLMLGSSSKSHMFVCDRFEVQASTGLHNPSSTNIKKSYAFRYVVQPGDTLAKIAAKFKIEASKIQEDNRIKNPNRIMAAQVLIINKGDGNTDKANEKPNFHMSPSDKANNSLVKVAAQVRSKEGIGHPLAVVPVAQQRAPWMRYAKEEAELRAGKKEAEITKTINYHKETGQSGNLATTPWCASFVNYCFNKAEYEHTHSASSQSFTWSKAFVKIDSPVYGAVVVYRNPKPKYDKAGNKYYLGHVAFVYCNLKEGDIAVLGGNQGDAISFNPHHKVYLDKNSGLGYDLVGFYVPAAYRNYAMGQIKLGGDLGPAQFTLRELRATFKQSVQASRSDLATR